MSNNVNHPKHYAIVDGVEAIDIIKVILGDGFKDYCYGNVIKYILRAEKKNGVEDFKKAQVYLDWMIKEIDYKMLGGKDSWIANGGIK